MMLKTRQKIVVAQLAYLAVAPLFRLLTGSTVTRVARKGIRWELDLCEAIDLSIFFMGRFEGASIKAYAKFVRPGDQVLDIGANIGAHTLPLAELVGPAGRVWAFEPTDFAFAKLTRNLELNPELALRVKATQAFVTADLSQRREVPEIYSSWPLQSVPSRHPVHCGQLKTSNRASLVSIDELVESKQLARVDCIKLDVDGFENEVLASASQTIKRFKPVIFMEMAPYLFDKSDGSFERLVGVLAENNYVLTEIGSDRLIPTSARYLRDYVTAGCSINVVARAS